MLLPFLFTHAQTIETNAKQNPTVNYERLKRIDTLLNDYINKHSLTGAVTLIIKDNQLIQYKGYDYADVDRPMKNNAIFRIMSQTKAITSVGIMILYEQGKLLLDEPITDFIPEFKHQVVLDKFNAEDTTYSEGTFSWGGYFGTTYWADPKENLVGLIMTQHTPNSHVDLVQKFESLVYASLKEK